MKRVKTRHCPACESGMEAPGIRHTKECKRNQENAKRGKVDFSKATHDESMTVVKDLVDMEHDQKAIDDELAHELDLSSESNAVEHHGMSSEGLAVGHEHENVHGNDMEVGPEYLATEVAMTSRNMKRSSDVPLVELERSE